MLNVLRLYQTPERPSMLVYVASALGLFLGVAGTFLQVQWAEWDIPTLLQQKQQLETVLLHATPTQLDEQGMQTTLTQAKQRVQALDQRQSMRLDLQEVQALLFAKKPIPNGNQITACLGAVKNWCVEYMHIPCQVQMYFFYEH